MDMATVIKPTRRSTAVVMIESRPAKRPMAVIPRSMDTTIMAMAVVPLMDTAIVPKAMAAIPRPMAMEVVPLMDTAIVRRAMEVVPLMDTAIVQRAMEVVPLMDMAIVQRAMEVVPLMDTAIV